jgi:hypothetical protein
MNLVILILQRLGIALIVLMIVTGTAYHFDHE